MPSILQWLDLIYGGKSPEANPTFGYTEGEFPNANFTNLVDAQGQYVSDPEKIKQYQKSLKGNYADKPFRPLTGMSAWANPEAANYSAMQNADWLQAPIKAERDRNLKHTLAEKDFVELGDIPGDSWRFITPRQAAIATGGNMTLPNLRTVGQAGLELGSNLPMLELDAALSRERANIGASELAAKDAAYGSSLADERMALIEEAKKVIRNNMTKSVAESQRMPIGSPYVNLVEQGQITPMFRDPLGASELGMQMRNIRDLQPTLAGGMSATKTIDTPWGKMNVRVADDELPTYDPMNPLVVPRGTTGGRSLVSQTHQGVAPPPPKVDEQPSLGAQWTRRRAQQLGQTEVDPNEEFKRFFRWLFEEGSMDAQTGWRPYR